jgi:hypothetical protein
MREGWIGRLASALFTLGIVACVASPPDKVEEAETQSQAIAATVTLANPTDITVDAAGNVFVIDRPSGGAVVRKITPTGVATTVGDLAPYMPYIYATTGIAVDAQGNVLVGVDTAILKLTPSGGLSVFAGHPEDVNNPVAQANGTGTAARFRNIYHSLHLDTAGNLFLVDEGGNFPKITWVERKITAAAVVSTVATLPPYDGYSLPDTAIVSPSG